MFILKCVRKYKNKTYFYKNKFTKTSMKCYRKSKKEKPAIEKSGIFYNDYKHIIRPLDLVMFRGGDFVSDIIRYLEKRKGNKISSSGYNIESDDFSHVGTVVSREILDDPRLEPGKLYIWESTMSGRLTDKVYNMEDKSYLGVQLRDLDEVVNSYDSDPSTRIAFCPIKEEYINMWNEERVLLKQRFTGLFNKYNGTRYDANLYSLTSSMFKCLRPKRDKVEDVTGTEEWLFCSEMVAMVYKELGFFSGNVEPKNVVPMDFLGYDVDGGGIPVVVKEPFYVTIFVSEGGN